MPKPYNIYKKDKIYLIIGNDFSRIEDYIADLNIELSKKQFIGDVIFDLLLSNGNGSMRFYKAFFDGQHIITTSFIKVTSPDNKILRTTMDYFSKNKSLMVNSVLSQREINSFFSSSLSIY